MIILGIVQVTARLTEQEEKVRCLRDEVERMQREREILPLLIRTEIRAHEERIRLMMEANDD